MRRLPSTDGVEVAVVDLAGPSGSRPLLFAHATGFCASVFSPLALHLAGDFHCWGLDLRGHGSTVLPDPPGTDHIWRGFADDVLTAVDGLGLERPVGVGHSSGGAALLMAEVARPGTFAALWCFEPIVWPEPERARKRAVRMAEGAARRRDRFPSRQDAYANFASKLPLSQLAPAALQAYVEDGFGDDADGSVTLRCPPRVEGAVYLGALDDDRFRRLREVTCPVVVACGGGTDAIQPDIAGELAAAVPHGRLRVFDRLGHFGPLEDPPGVARAVLDDLV